MLTIFVNIDVGYDRPLTLRLELQVSKSLSTSRGPSRAGVTGGSFATVVVRSEGSHPIAGGTCCGHAIPGRIFADAFHVSFASG